MASERFGAYLSAQAVSKLIAWANETRCTAGTRPVLLGSDGGEATGAAAAAATASTVDGLWVRTALLLVYAHLPHEESKAQKALQDAARRLHRLGGVARAEGGGAAAEVWAHLGVF